MHVDCITRPRHAATISTIRRVRRWASGISAFGFLILAVAAAAPILAPGCILINPPDNGDDGPIEAGTVETIAGDVDVHPGYFGDGGDARAARFDTPLGVAVDESGAVFILDTGNNRLRRIEPTTGVVDTLAGDGTTDGEAALRGPTGFAFDGTGGFFVSSDAVHHYAADGRRTVLVGNQSAGACLPQDAGPAVDAAILEPQSIGLLSDSTVLISEKRCHRIRQVSFDGILTTFAGTGEEGYAGDGGMAVDAKFDGLIGDAQLSGLGFALSPESPPDELYVADTGNNVIREINLLNGRIETFAGTGVAGFADGPPEQATFRAPTAVFVTSDHAVWVVDTGNHAIRRINPLGTAVETIAGTGVAGFNDDGLPAAETQFNDPRGIFITEDGVVYVADTGNHRIRKFATGTAPHTD